MPRLTSKYPVHIQDTRSVELDNNIDIGYVFILIMITFIINNNLKVTVSTILSDLLNQILSPNLEQM